MRFKPFGGLIVSAAFVSFSALAQQQPPVQCEVPGQAVVVDPTGDHLPVLVPLGAGLDVTAIHVAEIAKGEDSDQIAITLTTGEQTVLHPLGRWTVRFVTPDRTIWYVALDNGFQLLDSLGPPPEPRPNPGAPNFEYGTFAIDPTTGVGTYTGQGNADVESGYDAKGMITFVLSKTKILYPLDPGMTLTGITAITQQLVGTGDTGGGLLTLDSTDSGNYTLVGREACAQGAPEARMTASHRQGNVPLTVQLDAGASSAADGSALTYRFDFGDGSPALEQDGAQTTHTYMLEGHYSAKVTVTDAAGRADSSAQQISAGVIAADARAAAQGGGALHGLMLMILLLGLHRRDRSG